jgi:hypothetical protein
MEMSRLEVSITRHSTADARRDNGRSGLGATFLDREPSDRAEEVARKAHERVADGDLSGRDGTTRAGVEGYASKTLESKTLDAGPGPTEFFAPAGRTLSKQ